MKNEIESVLEFYNAFEQPVGADIEDLSLSRACLRSLLLKEEVAELHSALVLRNVVEAADGIVDCIYILLGTAIEIGIAHKLPELFAEVHRSNMTKLGSDQKPILRDDGKIIKGPFFIEPDLRKILYP